MFEWFTGAAEGVAEAISNGIAFFVSYMLGLAMELESFFLGLLPVVH